MKYVKNHYIITCDFSLSSITFTENDYIFCCIKHLYFQGYLQGKDFPVLHIHILTEA